MNSLASKDCLAKAEACHQQADRDPARRAHWLRQAEEWTRQAGARSPDGTAASTHEVCDGKLIPKPPK